MQTPLPEAELRRALDGLKDFQRKTVDHIFRRMYLDDKPARRMLISDEVGLGKTLVARGVIAKALEHLWSRVKRIDVVYICSNGDIARQNVNRLRVLSREDGGMRSATRLTLLASQLAKLGDVNFIALTPGTSFDLGSSLGVASERAMLYWLLRDAWGFGGQAGPLNVLRGNAARDSFRDRVRDAKPEEAVLHAVAEPFSKALGEAGDLRTEFEALCELFAWDRKHVPDVEARRRNQFVGRVRAVLARTCVNELTPDLVILDEFQRFKHLMQDEGDACLLARTMFDYADEHGEAKVLLLSATPYKMLTLAAQGDEEDHYRDFLETLRFLQTDAKAFEQLKHSVDAFRLGLLRLRTGGAIEHVLTAKAEVERGLRNVIVRTERLAATPDRSGMLSEVSVPLALQAADLESYISAQRIAELVGDRDVMEYWKSGPYAMNFLEGYKIRDRLKRAVDDPEVSPRLVSEIRSRPEHYLSAAAVRNLDAVRPANPRLRAILAETVESGAWRMLWAPPCLTTYKLSGPYGERSAKAFTKQLVFSAWRMVPRAVATLVSHAADHCAVTEFEASRGRASAGASRWPSPLLRFQSDVGGRLTGMPLFVMLYPSAVLADLDPLQVVPKDRSNGDLPSLEDVLTRTEATLSERLRALGPVPQSATQADESWYWAAPVLLDLQDFPAATRAWLRQPRLSGVWAGATVGGAEEEAAYWSAHVKRLQDIVDSAPSLGPMPIDLPRVLAEAAVGSPAVASYRALRRLIPGWDEGIDRSVRDASASISWALRNLFNLPESIAILRGTGQTEPYWRRVLQYCADGGLQAVLDEYFHVLVESLGLAGATPANVIEGVAEAVRGALGIRPAAVGVDEFRIDDTTQGMQITTSRLRSRFAMPFADARPEDPGTGAGDEGEVTRMEKVRDAFNSPFWPFVLVSTSVGQEGLDFHPYCHVVVHWNLPSNPVDLEQREGRVHRYKGHAVRKNVAQAFGAEALHSGARDPWSAAFELARAGRPAGATDIVPYWLFPLEGGARIERRVPALPLSKDLLRMADLRRTLAVYRLVFGQPRQEDLIEFLMSRFDGEQLKQICSELRVDLAPQ